MATPKIIKQSNYFIGQYLPGNGTRYTAVAVPWNGGGMLLGGPGGDYPHFGDLIRQMVGRPSS